MSALINKTDMKEPIKKKRKHSLGINDNDSDLSTSKLKKPKKKNKKKLSNRILPHDGNGGKFMQYKDTKNYTSVIANPGSLKPAPQIFQKNNFRNSMPSNSDLFLYNLISMSSFNTDINQRFNHMNLINENRQVEREKKTTKKLRISHNESDSAQVKRRKEKQESNIKNDSVSEEEDFLSQVALYKVKENKGLIFHMHHKSSFSFHGEIKITVLSGEVEILGYTLSHSSHKNSVDVYSPNFYTAIVVETKAPKESKPIIEVESILKTHLQKADIASLLRDFRPNDAVLFIEQINSTVGAVINKYWETPLFPKDLQDFTSDCLTVKCIQSVFNFKLSRNGKHFKKNPQWDSIPLGSCNILCGGKGVGKSTLLKYFVNKLVSKGEKVLCLDFDVGQSEFAAPGCVSAAVVDQPLLGPNFTHVIDPLLMLYFGDVDVAQNPSGYLECVKHVIESCRKNAEFSRMKWFVNTIGFNKGLGVYLMTSIIKLLQPNTVIQIQGAAKNNYPFFLTTTNLNSMSGFKSMPLECVHLSHDLRIVSSYAETSGFGRRGEVSQGAMKPRALRDVMSLSYFSQLVSPPYYNFNAVQPYLIHFSKIYLGIHSLIDLNDILKAFNANIVSLLKFEPDSEEIYSVDSEDEDYFKIVVKPKMTPCVGLGFVRGIDCKEKNFYVMSHLPRAILNQVNCFCLGKISPPHAMFLRQETVENQSPYTTFGTVNIIQRVKRTFHGSATPQKLL